MKSLFVLLLGLWSVTVFAQVQGVDYLMKYNCDANVYDVSIVILSGSASSITERAQFNSQITIAVPTGEQFQFVEQFMPLRDNQDYMSVEPMEWKLGNAAIAPADQPAMDFYPISPVLSPASFYNDLNAGDVVKLFSFVAGDSGQYDEGVRFFNNGEDPDDSAAGMNGGDYSNGFTLGGPLQIYQGNRVESCVTNVSETGTDEMSIYPNPFDRQFTIELPKNVESVKVINVAGEVMYQQSKVGIHGNINIAAQAFPAGVYIVRLEKADGYINRKVVKY